MRRFRLFLLAFCVLASSLTASWTLLAKEFDWPQWRGPNRDGLSKETGLLKAWPTEGPARKWTTYKLGGGFSTPSVADGKIFLMSNLNNEEVVIALRESDGKVLWTEAVGPKAKVGYDQGPRSTPTIDGEYLYAVGAAGTLVCLKTADGSLVWSKDYNKDLKGRMMSGWGFSESPLIDGDQLICTPGGDQAGLAALNKKTGEVIWKSELTKAGGAGYSSPMKITVGDTKMYFNWFGSALIGVNAADGKKLWSYDHVKNGTANIPTPIVKGDLIFTSTGYGAGSALIKLVPEGDGITVKEQYFLKASDLQNHHGGMVLLGDHIYLGHGHNAGAPTCVELATGKVVWREDRGPGSGSAGVMVADGNVYFRYQNGVIALIEASPKEYKLISKFKQPEYSGTEAWAHPVIANGNLYIADQDKLLCFSLKAE